MVITAPFIHNWKALNIFRPVKERGKIDALCEINTQPKCFVYVSLKSSMITNKLQLTIIFRMIFIKEPELEKF